MTKWDVLWHGIIRPAAYKWLLWKPVKKQITYIHPNIKLPHNAQVWKHKSFNYYAGRHLSLAEYFTKQIVQKESLDTFSEIKNAFTVIQSRESRRILELNESKASGAPSDKTFTHLVTDRTITWHWNAEQTNWSLIWILLFFRCFWSMVFPNHKCRPF